MTSERRGKAINMNKNLIKMGNAKGDFTKRKGKIPDGKRELLHRQQTVDSEVVLRMDQE